MENEVCYFPKISDVEAAAERISSVVVGTPLIRNDNFSEVYGANVYFKREDLQPVRSYKIRGAFNKISHLKYESSISSVVCVSAGNHAQGVALSCFLLKMKGVIFMPVTTPNQKVVQVERFGMEYVEIKLIGDTFDDSFIEAKKFSRKKDIPLVHPFDDEKIIEGQGTVGLEVLCQLKETIDYLFLPVGGGGLAAGVSAVFKQYSPQTKVIGVEPLGAPSMSASFSAQRPIRLSKIDKFVDGAAVQEVGGLNFNICRQTLHGCVTVAEGKICDTIIDLYNREGLVVEPAGALSLSALEEYKTEIKNKTVVCVISGSNNDITRTEEIKERALIYQGLKHYFIVNFPQRPGALRDFLANVLGEDDDITFFEYSKKHSRENGSATVGILLGHSDDFEKLTQKMKANGFYNEYLNDKPHLMDVLV